MMTEKPVDNGRENISSDPTELPTEPRMPVGRRRKLIDFASLVESMSTGVMIQAPDSTVLFMNKAFSDYLKIENPDQFLNQSGEHLGEAIKHQFVDPEGFVERMRGIFRKMTLTEREVLALTDNRVIELEFIPVIKDGKVINVFWHIFDVTEEMLAVDALRQSEERYRTIIENIEDGYYEVDLRGNFTFANESLCQMVGYTRDAVLGKPYTEFYGAAASAEAVMKAFNHVFRTTESLPNVETTVVHSDGRHLQVEISVRLIEDAAGTPLGFRGIVRDVTLRKAAESSLSKRINLLATLQLLNAELSQTLDLEAILSGGLAAAMHISDADCGMIGLIEDDFIRVARSRGYVFDDELGPSRLISKYQGVIGRCARTGQPQLVLDVINDPDYVDALPGVEAQIALPLTHQDQVIGVINLETKDKRNFTPDVFEYVQVVTARMNAAMDKARLYSTAQDQVRTLQALNAQLSELEQLKTDMIRVAAHDVRSPLGIINGFLSVLRADLDEMLTDEHRMFFDAISRSVERIAHISRDILSLERLDAKMKGQRHVFELKTAINSVVADHRATMQMRKMTFNLSMPDEQTCVEADPAVLREAISNLLGNAIKYTPDGGSIRVNMTINETHTRVEIEDSGYGIPVDLQDRLFQPFYRAKSHDTREIEGTGLGLFLVKKIIEGYGGEIHFRSAPGKGSMFGFTLPLVENDCS